MKDKRYKERIMELLEKYENVSFNNDNYLFDEEEINKKDIFKY